MAYDDKLAFRIGEILASRSDTQEKKMFGGICFMVGEHMACGVHGNELIIRMAPDDAVTALKGKHVRPFDITGRPMKGYVFVAPQGCATKPALKKWIDTSVAFVAMLPPKKKKKRALKN